MAEPTVAPTASAQAPFTPGATLAAQRRRAILMFVTPMLLVLAGVAGWSLVLTIWYGFTDASLGNLAETKFVGLANYYRTLTLPSGRSATSGLLLDTAWWRAVWNTLRFAFLSVAFETVFGMIIALVLNAEFRGRAIVRAAVLVPWAIPTIVSAKMWAWMMHDQFGILNDLLMRLHLIASPIAWTASPDTAMVAVLIVDVWKTTPFMALLILAGLQMIPRDVYEAARIDGVNPLKVFWKVTLPLVRPALMVAIIFRLLDALRVFDLVYVLTPNNEQTRTMSVFAQQNLFQFDKFAYGSAASTLLFLVIALITIVTISLGRVNTGEPSR